MRYDAQDCRDAIARHQANLAWFALRPARAEDVRREEFLIGFWTTRLTEIQAR